MRFQTLIVNNSLFFRCLKSILTKIESVPITTMDIISTQLEVLTKRLKEAERRAKLLKLEVKSIRDEISSLQQNVTVIQNSEQNNIHTNRNPIALEHLPSTSRVDGFISNKNKRPLNDNGTVKKKSKPSFTKEGDYVLVYTDGACENNGRPNAKAGIGVWFGENHKLNISEPVEGKATNNTAEIQACVQALLVAKQEGVEKIKIFTDSQFTINCMTNWITNWKRNNWKTYSGGEVKNRTDLQILDDVVKRFEEVKWVHVLGHAGIQGNEEADKLARQGALRYKHKSSK